MGVFGARRLIGTFATAAAAIAVLSSCRTTPEASSPEPPAPEPTPVARQYWIGTVTYVTELDGVQMRDGTIVTGEATITWIFDDYPLLRDGLPEAQRDALVRDRYAEADLAREWEQHRTDSGNPDLREAVRDYVASPQFKQHQEHWARP